MGGIVQRVVSRNEIELVLMKQVLRAVWLAYATIYMTEKYPDLHNLEVIEHILLLSKCLHTFRIDILNSVINTNVTTKTKTTSQPPYFI